MLAWVYFQCMVGIDTKYHLRTQSHSEAINVQRLIKLNAILHLMSSSQSESLVSRPVESAIAMSRRSYRSESMLLRFNFLASYWRYRATPGQINYFGSDNHFPLVPGSRWVAVSHARDCNSEINAISDSVGTEAAALGWSHYAAAVKNSKAAKMLFLFCS